MRTIPTYLLYSCHSTNVQAETIVQADGASSSLQTHPLADICNWGSLIHSHLGHIDRDSWMLTIVAVYIAGKVSCCARGFTRYGGRMR